MNFEVFPDYCSTGLWDADSRRSIDWQDIDPDAVDHVAQGLLAGVTQWNWLGELFMAENKVSDLGLGRWRSDGAKLVAALNAHYAGEHTFLYRTDLL